MLDPISSCARQYEKALARGHCNRQLLLESDRRELARAIPEQSLDPFNAYRLSWIGTRG